MSFFVSLSAGYSGVPLSEHPSPVDIIPMDPSNAVEPRKRAARACDSCYKRKVYLMTL
jgi:hypothetical protein